MARVRVRLLVCRFPLYSRPRFQGADRRKGKPSKNPIDRPVMWRNTRPPCPAACAGWRWKASFSQMSGNGTSAPVSRKRLAGLTLAALGVVFGDIGTSPLYTMKECFSEYTGLKPTHEDVLGILSLITWTLIIVVSLKYVVVVMRADNRGEGGVLALMALIARRAGLPAGRRNFYVMLGMAGAALFYGDSLLTPAVTVLSSIEGLNVATRTFEPLVVPIALGVLIALFSVQRFGTGSVGRLFGPITL